jgi:hypothetical protein
MVLKGKRDFKKSDQTRIVGDGVHSAERDVVSNVISQCNK